MKFSFAGLLVAATMPSVAWSFVGPNQQIRANAVVSSAAPSSTQRFMADGADEEKVLNKYSR